MIYRLSVLTSNTTWKGSKLSFEEKKKSCIKARAVCNLTFLRYRHLSKKIKTDLFTEMMMSQKIKARAEKF